MNPPDYEYLRKLLKDNSGLDLSADKQYLIESRLLPLSRKCGLPGISELVQKMKGGSASIIAQVVEAMTTNETFFFRDKIPFDHFRDLIMPEILKARAARKNIRIWCAAGGEKAARFVKAGPTDGLRPSRRSANPNGLSRSPRDRRRLARSSSPRHQMAIVRDWLRPADQIALNFRSFPGNKGPLVLGLHAFGDHGQCKRTAEPQNGVDDRRRRR